MTKKSTKQKQVSRDLLSDGDYIYISAILSQ